MARKIIQQVQRSQCPAPEQVDPMYWMERYFAARPAPERVDPMVGFARYFAARPAPAGGPPEAPVPLTVPHINGLLARFITATVPAPPQTLDLVVEERQRQRHD